MPNLDGFSRQSQDLWFAVMKNRVKCAIAGIILVSFGTLLFVCEKNGYLGLTREGPIIALLGAAIVSLVALPVSILGVVMIAFSLINDGFLWPDVGELKEPPTSEDYLDSDALKQMVGMSALVVATLRPIGEVSINGANYSALAECGFVERGRRVQVVTYSCRQLIVKELVDDPDTPRVNGAIENHM